MKNSLDHLPERKRDELNRIVSLIRELCDDVEMIILFGSYARDDWKEEADLDPGRKSGHKSDYDVLVVVEEKSTAADTKVWHEITAKCDALGLSTHVRVIAHDIQYLNLQLAEGRYFFTDIKKEGYLLYDSGKFKLACKRKLKPAEQKRIAQGYYDDWFGIANSFYGCYQDDVKSCRWKLAAFHLHQAAEASYKTILLVFTGYNPNEHYLSLLGEMAAEQDSSLSDVFPQGTDRERELFRLLDYAYIGARYDPDYQIAEEDLEYLSERVKVLLELTDRLCNAKIENVQ